MVVARVIPGDDVYAIMNELGCILRISAWAIIEVGE